MSRKTGDLAEEKAAMYLKQRGYEILARNYYVQGAEIDIIARRDETIAFIEIKYRTSARFAAPRESVTLGKQRRICRAALLWLQENACETANVCFDIIEVLPAGIAHLKNAFDFVE